MRRTPTRPQTRNLPRNIGGGKRTGNGERTGEMAERRNRLRHAGFKNAGGRPRRTHRGYAAVRHGRELPD